MTTVGGQLENKHLIDNLESFQLEVQILINKLSLENLCDTPDFILAAYLKNCLVDYAVATRLRDKYYGKESK